MALIDCYECGKKISDIAPTCPNCGAPAKQGLVQQKKKIGFFKGLVIVIFWGVIGLFVLGWISDEKESQSVDPSSSKKEIYEDSPATYAEIDAQVGCESKYSDEKKEDIFSDNYYNKWMKWKGEIVLLEAGKASLNIDGKGTQDLSIEFYDEQAGYNLQKNKVVTVIFLMKRMGGCFLPFSGEQAVIVK